MNMENILTSIAELQGRHAVKISIFGLVLTLILGMGLLNLRLETDFSKELPQDNPAIKLDNRVRDVFGGTDVVLVVAQLNHSSTSRYAVRDIRDQRVREMLLKLGNEIKDERGVDSVYPPPQYFKIPWLFSHSKNFFNKDYSSTLLYIYTSIGKSNDRIKALSNAIKQDIASISLPPGVRLRLTGMVIVRAKLLEILVSDAKLTIFFASIIILLVLTGINLLANKSIFRGMEIFIPLVLSLIWTLGTMGWLNIPLSVVTVGVGAMILGLGVEYSVFYVTRFEEERDKGKDYTTSLKIALNEVGRAIIGSSTTTIVGFLALLTASLPMLHHLGFTLALGIFYCVVAAIFLNPALLVVEKKVLNKLSLILPEMLKR